jgi:L-ascorbate metabolism protein UlaG (beta-lactamase superfamily)
MLQIAGCWLDNQKYALEVTYIANEGYIITMGDTRVLIDALPKSEYYANPSDTLAAKVMDGIPPFDKIDYALVTHDHPDHFNAGMTSRFLLHHPAAQLVASWEACGKLTGDSISGRRHRGICLKMGQHQILRGDKAEIMVVRLSHGGDTAIDNLAYVVRSNGYTIVHVGDARLSQNEECLRTVDWSSYNVDLLFVEYFDRDSQTQDIVASMIRPKYVVLMHIPPGEEETIRNTDEKIHPRTVVFGRENETRRFDNFANDGSSH